MSKRSWQFNHFTLMGAACLALHAHAQKAAPPINVTVIVTNAITRPQPQPVKNAHVSLTHLINAQLAVDAQGPTNPRGEARLLISQSAARNGDLRIVISGAGNLVIYEPADGQLPNLTSPVKVLLLPTGSLALMGPAQIQAYLRRMLLEVNSLQKQVSTLKTQTTQEQDQQQYLTSALADFAQAMGFSRDQVNQQVEIWAQNIKLQATQATAEQKALAAFALKDYAAAAQDYEQAADATRKQIDDHETTAAAYGKAQQDEVDAALDLLRQLIKQHQSAAGLDQLRLKYHDATETLESAVASADAEYKKHPDDKNFHELWLQAVSDTANARWREGEVSPAGQSLPLLAQSADDFDSLAHDYAALGDRQAAAAAQNGCGLALWDEGERASGDKAMALLDQAIKAYQNALKVYTRPNLPQDWAGTQVGLGSALDDEGERVSDDKAAALFDQAVQAFHSALEVYTQPKLPLDWAMTQSNLGNALEDEGELLSGEKALDLFDQAARAYQSALTVYNQTDLPQDWANTQSSLGVVLEDEGDLASGEKALALFDRAAQAFRNALRVDTQTDLPQDWARTQSNLGTVLEDEGELVSGDKAAALFDQAVQAFQSTLTVYTQANLPQDWARAQNNLGNALMDEGERASGDKAAALLDQAAQAYQATLKVYTKADLPEDWADTTLSMMELNLIAGRFEACVQQGEILTADSTASPLLAIRDTLKLACQWAAGGKSAALATDTCLLKNPRSSTTLFWDFTSTTFFLSHSSQFANGRASWIALFNSVQNGDRAGMIAALRQLEPLLQQ